MVCGICIVCLDFFFCKQKTAYEMRISDWSSEVCSSDLLRLGVEHVVGPLRDRVDPCPTSEPVPLQAGRPHPLGRASLAAQPLELEQIGRASCRERVCPYV